MPQEPTQEPVSRRLRRLVAPGVDEVADADAESCPHAAVPAPTGAVAHGSGEAVVPGSTGPTAPGLTAPGLTAPPGLTDVAAAALTDPAVPGSTGHPEQAIHPTRRLPGPNPFDPGRRGVRALAVLAVLAVVAAVVLAWRTRPRTEPVPDAALAAPAAERVTADGGPGRADGPVESAAGEVVVAVAGKVRRPGLVRLPAGARVADAIEAAGGSLPGAEVAFLNLARKVTDGELILVGVTAPPGALDQGAGTGAAVPGTTGTGPATGPVNLNTATPAQLDTLPGVGPVLAQRIIDHREQHGAFRAVSDLRQVNGIGDARYEQLKKLVTV